MSAASSEDRKRPALPEWKTLQREIADLGLLQAWFQGEEWVEVVAGEVSGALEVIDFDVPNKHEPGFNGGHAPLWEPFLERCIADGLHDLLHRLTVCSTPSGGRHIVYRCPGIRVPGSMKLAQEQVDGRVETLIETRGEGGYFVAPPSKGYAFESGSLEGVAEISIEEREALHAVCRSLNRRWSDPIGTMRNPSSSESRPGNDYNRRGPSCLELLEVHGWKRTGVSGEWENLCRPGKDGGTSGGVSREGGTFYVFSTNAEPFEAGRPYSRFAVYALLEHGGDFAAAAKTLAVQGYGRPTNEARSTSGGRGDFVYACTSYRLQSIGDMLEKEPEETSWLVDGLLIAGGTSLVAAKPKVGKSTLLRWLAFCVARGIPFLGNPTRQGTVIYLAIEEKEAQIIELFRAMGASKDDPIQIHVGQAPTEALRELIPIIEDVRPALVIVDPLLKFVRVPDANDYARLSTALEPVIGRREGLAPTLRYRTTTGRDSERTGTMFLAQQPYSVRWIPFLASRSRAGTGRFRRRTGTAAT
ncbi:MAG: AAA family ATPase [Fimbriimonadales bacterium]